MVRGLAVHVLWLRHLLAELGQVLLLAAAALVERAETAYAPGATTKLALTLAVLVVLGERLGRQEPQAALLAALVAQRDRPCLETQT